MTNNKPKKPTDKNKTPKYNVPETQELDKAIIVSIQ